MAEAAEQSSAGVVEPKHFIHQSHRIPDAPVTSTAGEETQDHSIELEGGSQNFFPSFAHLFQPRHQPLVNSRLPTYFNNQEGAYSQRPNPLKQLLNYQAPSFGGFKNNDFVKQQSAPARVGNANGILGSGNFGVLSGGTFFGETSDTESDYGGSFSNPYDGNNGHGRPAFYFGNSDNNRPYNHDQFANFRDFADINAPANSAYSHFVVVYANENGTITEVQPSNADSEVEDAIHVAKPKNIIERLSQIEEETPLTSEEVTKKSKTSKSKLKLALIKDKKFGKNNNKKAAESAFKDLSDPLIALS